MRIYVKKKVSKIISPFLKPVQNVLGQLVAENQVKLHSLLCSVVVICKCPSPTEPHPLPALSPGGR